ncbi:Glycosyl transferase group 1 [Candidatus Nitrospira nitrosa]|uniref:Glycosyl transferase group 1 n=1 Tax=Candidatus Nitrospira nitrosa TaxID=1742972 RepID=A0A0S4LFV8_9BACT|nr:glycosyltransferase family 4 protein [Candidatus Nitrospira nitrosa]CUS34884.1 Glycosyl transferase group 1 [Candidatus Nitrospira nitrosa]
MTSEKQSRPSVLLVGNFLSASKGVRGVCEDLAQGLKAAGWSVTTTSSRPGRFARLVDFLLTVWRYRNRYQVAQVDVFSGPAFLWAELVCLALRIVKKPYVLTLHGGNLPAFAKRSGKRVPHLLQSASVVTAPSGYLLEQMCTYRQDIVLLPNSLELTNYSFKHRAHPTLNLMWLRAFHDIYDPSLAVKVVSLLAKDFSSVRLQMIGPDKGDGSRDKMMSLARELGVHDRVTCPGKVPKSATAHWLQQGDIFLNTAKVDNTPVSVIEAMACGLCVVSTNVGGIPYLLKDEWDALIVPAGDEAAMAAAIRRIVTEGELAQRLSHNGRRKVEEFGWSHILPRWEKLLTKVAAEGRT